MVQGRGYECDTEADAEDLSEFEGGRKLNFLGVGRDQARGNFQPF